MFKLTIGAGGSTSDAFKEVAQTKGGAFQSGLLGSQPKALISFHDWTLVLDTDLVSNGNSSSEYTRVYAAFENPREIEFDVLPAPRYLKKFFHFFNSPVVVEIGSIVGRAQEVRGPNAAQIKRIFQDPKVQEAVEGYDKNRITVERGAKFYDVPRERRRVGVDTLLFEFQYLEKHVPTLLQVVGVIETLLLAIDQESRGEATPLAPHQRPLLDAVLARLDERLGWTSQRTERTPEGATTFLFSPVSGVDCTAELRVSAPAVPFFESDLHLQAQIVGGPPATLQTPESLIDKMANFRDLKLGDDEADDRFLIDAPKEALPFLQALVPALSPLAKDALRSLSIALTPSALEVSAKGCDQAATAEVAERLVGLWRRVLEQGLGSTA